MKPMRAADMPTGTVVDDYDPKLVAPDAPDGYPGFATKLSNRDGGTTWHQPAGGGRHGVELTDDDVDRLIAGGANVRLY